MRNKVAAVAALLLLTTAGAAQAQSYPPGGNTITADSTSVAPGGAIVLGIQICQASATATFELDGSTSLGTATADSNGVASLSTTIPSGTTPGSHTIEGECIDPNGQPLVQVLSITVTGGTGIPVTGSSNTMPMTQIAVGVIAAGGLLVLLAKKGRGAKRHPQETVGV